MVVGPVDCWACIWDLLQYPQEVKYLYLLMSFISPVGMTRFTIRAAGQGVRVIPVQINVNLSSSTVEELLGQKKHMHCAAFRFLFGELKKLANLTEKGGAAA